MFQSTPSGGKATEYCGLRIDAARWFQSTPSGGKATRSPASWNGGGNVSIHAFRGEGDARGWD